ncbi:mitochondrial carrier, partial [Fragilariopsis cylindrus CCMP1102]
MYTGALPTFLGSTIGYGFRFATYDKTVHYMEQILLMEDDDNDNANNNNKNSNSNSSKRKNILPVIIGGGLAGMATWLSHYPLDLVANKMMADIVLPTSNLTDSSKTIRKKIGMIDQFRIIYKQYGWKGYFRGIGPCLLRAFPVNAAIFVSYEFCMGN